MHAALSLFAVGPALVRRRGRHRFRGACQPAWLVASRAQSNDLVLPVLLDLGRTSRATIPPFFLTWREIDVVVRHDLGAAGPAAVENYFITSNFLRRQLSPLGKARCIRRLMEVEQGCTSDRFNCFNREELKTRLGAAIGMSPRNICRYLLVLEAPTEVQRAFDAGELKLIDAGRVALLGKEVQAAIAKRIAAGESAADVVRESLKHDKAGDDLHRAFVRLRSCLSRELPQLDGRIDELRSPAVARSCDLLQKSHALIGALVERAESHRDDEDNHDPFPGFAV